MGVAVGWEGHWDGKGSRVGEAVGWEGEGLKSASA